MTVNKDVYIWFSGATDITGKTLMEKLNVSGGKTKPTEAKTVIGWGTKTKTAAVFAKNIKMLNHPNSILNNRNKFGALKKLNASGVPVAKFMNVNNVVNADLPVIGRTNWHQGGKGFWICPTMALVKNAVDEGAQYFQKLIEIKDEYRLHVFNGQVIYSVKKVKRDNMTGAFVAQNKEKIESMAAKNDVTLAPATVDYVLEQVAKQHKEPDMIIRSNTRGWKFSRVTNIMPGLRDAAIASVKALELEFAAVDCCVDVKGDPYIIELNTGPGLKGSALDAYVAALKGAIDKKKATKTTMATVKVKSAGGKSKTSLEAKAALMTDMIQNADDTEAEALESIFAKMFSE
ncbi:MAG: hypothetical protein JJV94_07200 [Sulfurospirillum sp.]|nr:hypothetical protein [Sulfurospirillum sp.]